MFTDVLNKFVADCITVQVFGLFSDCLVSGIIEKNNHKYTKDSQPYCIETKDDLFTFSVYNVKHIDQNTNAIYTDII